MKVTVIPVVIGVLGKVIKGLVKGLEEQEIRTRVATIETVKIDQNTEKSPCDLQWIKTSVKLSKDSNKNNNV